MRGQQLQSTPQSYRSLLAGYKELEEVAEEWQTSELQAFEEVRSMQRETGAKNRLAKELRASQTSLKAELSNLRGEAARIWQLHEDPLQGEEGALHALTGTIETLEKSVAKERVDAEQRRLEYTELQHLSQKLTREVDTGRRGNLGLLACVESAVGSHQHRSCVWSESECRNERLRKEVVDYKDKVRLMESEADSRRLHIRKAQQELVELEKEHTASMSAWRNAQFTSSEAQHASVEALESELQHCEQALKRQTQEAGTWREQTFRTEQRLCAQQRTDVSSALRTLGDNCRASVRAASASEDACAKRP